MKYLTKAMKVAIGSTLAIIIAGAIGLEYAVSAGIITLLTLQDTKKETLSVAIRRMVAFVIAALIAYFVLSLFSFSIWSFGIFLFLFVLICLQFGLQDAIAMNAVLATHYLLERSVSPNLILNEAILMLIGAGIGIVLNLYIPGNVMQIRKEQGKIQFCLKAVLYQMAGELRDEKQESPREEQEIKREEQEIPREVQKLQQEYIEQSRMEKFEELKRAIERGLQHAYQNRQNTFFQETEYFVRFMKMREEQYYVLYEIFEKINTLQSKTKQSLEVADFIEQIAESLSESQNSKVLLINEENLMQKFKEAPLPATRDEFETRAVLYVILVNFRLFLKMKKRFVDSLTEEQKAKYWEGNNAGI